MYGCQDDPGQITIIPKHELMGILGGFPYGHAVCPSVWGFESETRQPWCPGNMGGRPCSAVKPCMFKHSDIAAYSLLSMRHVS